MSEQPDPSCPFCAIASSYAPYPPTSPPPATSPHLSPTVTSPQTHLILSTPHVVSFLDILPLAPAHLLLCPRAHRPKLTDVAGDEAAEMGRYLPVLSRAVVEVLGEGTDWNVVQNNGVGAGQVVGHVHFHVIPRRSASSGEGWGGSGSEGEGRFAKSFAMFGKGAREELDDDEGREMAARLREAVAEVLRRDNSKL
ncbi:related to histidine triad protein [Cephalotrichum gorgonifer]|uniref:Related to histidine triad protein n=1 Tax=Cephalotrichum gorgonifer TaxID=2041049 RepID=A0AAE8SWV8_9PEZI|nr:related to histidine triad protein [Cephalotrichum gorgonifer]